MLDPHSDLWPDDIAEVGNLVTPLSVLKEQAALLARKTNNLLKASVVRWHEEYADQWAYGWAFYLVAPVLSDYKYLLFTIKQDTKLYPLVIENRPGDATTVKISNQEEFLAELRAIFCHTETKSVIKAMLAQVRDFGGNGSAPTIHAAAVDAVTEDDTWP